MVELNKTLTIKAIRFVDHGSTIAEWSKFIHHNIANRLL